MNDKYLILGEENEKLKRINNTLNIELNGINEKLDKNKLSKIKLKEQ